MTTLRTHYDNLKVARDAPDAVIRAAYKVLVQKYHPDKNPDDARAARVMQIINQSYGVLSDPVQRKEHDEWIRAQELLQAADALNRARAAASESAPPPKPKPQESPIPPQWRQPDVKPSNPNVLAALLAWPFKLLWRTFIAAPQLTFLALLFGGFWLWDALTPDKPPPPGPKPYQAEAPVETAMSEPAPAKPAYVRPATAPNGSAWPTRASYIKGYPVDNDSGYSEVTVDNAQNDADVFVKLVSLDAATAFPVRQFYIPAGSSFTMDKVTAGKYDLRYQSLDTGGLSRSEAFDVEETRSDDGVQYSSLTMTLYKVQDGNFQTYALAADEF